MLTLLLGACVGAGGVDGVTVSPSSTTAPPSTTTGAIVPWTTLPPTPCDYLTAPEAVGLVDTPAISEASGLVAGRADPTLLWIHNDSGAPEMFALDDTGRLQATVELTDVTAGDWEDLAVGPGPDPEAAYLYVGDIGDNENRRDLLTIWRLREPSLEGLPDGGLLQAGAERLDFVYPDGPHDAETLLVDPISGSLYVITKELSGRSGVYRVEWDDPQPVTARLVRTIDLGVGGLATGGDITPDGGVIAIRTYGDVRLWTRPAGSSVEEALAGGPCRGPLAVEPQGEAIGFAPGGLGYYTISEGAEPPLYLVKSG